MTPPAPTIVPLDVNNPPRPVLMFQVTCMTCGDRWLEAFWRVAMSNGETYCSQLCYDNRSDAA